MMKMNDRTEDRLYNLKRAHRLYNLKRAQWVAQSSGMGFDLHESSRRAARLCPGVALVGLGAG